MQLSLALCPPQRRRAGQHPISLPLCRADFPHWFGIARAGWPFLFEVKDERHFLLDFLRDNAQKVGLQRGDQLIAINGIPIQSGSAFADLLASSPSGSTWDVNFRREAQSTDRHATVVLQRWETQNDPILILFYLAVPAFCLALGFWVVFVRLNDVRAWLLLFFLLSVATAFDSFSYFGNPVGDSLVACIGVFSIQAALLAFFCLEFTFLNLSLA